jgi:hypothetical protein
VPRVSAIVAGCVFASLAFVASPLAAAPSIYKLSAKALIPSADVAGFDRITSQSAKPITGKAALGLTSSWTADYTSAANETGVGTIGVLVFRSEAAAGVQYSSACSSGCDVQRWHGWRLKRSFELSPSGNRFRIVSVVANCRNLVVGGTISALDNKDHLTIRLKSIVDAMFGRAVATGMTRCGSQPVPPPSGQKFYWSEDQANAIVVAKVRLPDCVVIPSDTDCAGRTGFALSSADCQGYDELGTSFTFNRFECRVLTYGGDFEARIAVYVTGPTTFRWKTL